MDLVKSKTTISGFLFLVVIVAGVFSVAPAVDGTNYLTEAAANPNQVIFATLCQLMMAFAYLGIAILLYPIIKIFDKNLSLGFLSFRIVAASLVIIAALLLPLILTLSEEFAKNPTQASTLAALGTLLKNMRDHINHVFMIIVLCAGNLMFYILLFRSNLIPRWLSLWGMLGNLLSIIASVLVLYQAVDIITTTYILLNVPTAIQELILALWLIIKGFGSVQRFPIHAKINR